jgi:hypothetical protein
MRKRLASALSGIADSALARPARTIAIASLALLLLGLASTGIRVDGRVDALLPDADRVLALYAGEARRQGGAEMIFVDVSSEDPAALDGAVLGVESRLLGSPLLAGVSGGGDPAARARTMEVLRRAVPVLLPEEEYPGLEARLRPEAVEDRVDEIVAALLAPAGAVRMDALVRDPLGLLDLALARTASRVPVEGARAEKGRLTSADGKRALLVAASRAPLGDEEAARGIASLLEDARRALPRGAALAWTGGHRFYLANSESIQRDVQRISILAFALVLAVVAVGFRGARVVFIAAIVVVAGALGAAAAAAVAYGQVAALALVFGAALSGITVDYAVHLHAEPRSGETRRDAVRRVFAEAATSVAVGAATSAAAFLVLLGSGIPAHRQMGLASAAGILVSATFALVAGPALAMVAWRDRPAPRAPAPTVLERTCTSWFRFVLARPGAGMAAALLVMAGSAALLPLVRFEPDLRRFEAKDPATAAEEKTVTGHWGDVLARSMLLVQGRDEAGALEAAEKAEAALAPFVGGEAGEVTGLSRLLPSPAVQASRAAAWARFWSGGRADRLREDLERAGAVAGLRRGTFAPFLDSIRDRPEVLTAASWEGTLFAPILRRHLSAGSEGVRVLVLLSGARDPREPGVRWAEAVRAVVPGAIVLTRRGLADAVVGAARQELQGLAFPALLVVGLLLLWYYRSPARALVGLFPLAGALMATAAVLALAGEPLSMMNVPVAIPIFGLGVDYAVFLMDALEGAEPGPAAAAEVGRRSAPLLGAWLTTLAGGAAMLTASHPAGRTLGSALVLGEGASLLFAWMAVPWLVGRRRGGAP